MKIQRKLALIAGTCWAASLVGIASAGDAVGDGWTDLVGTDACAAMTRELLAAETGASTELPLTPCSVSAPFSACFDPANPPSPEVMARINDLMMQSWLATMTINGGFSDRYNASTRWAGAGFGVTGDPINLTWSFVPDGLSITGSGGEPTSASSTFATWDAKLARASWISLYTQCFDRWQALTGVNYTRVTAAGVDWDDGAAWGSGVGATRGHVRISMHPIDGLSNILAYTFFPQNGDMVFDKNDATGNSNFFNSGNNYRFFRNTCMHEHGHGLGLAHECTNNSNALMEPFLSTAFDGPQQDDIRGAQRFYGDPNEIDNSTATAFFAGNLTAGGTLSLGDVPSPAVTNGSTLSIDANAEQDYHRIATVAKLLCNVTLTPIGSTYDDGDQAGDGSCPDGPDVNALAQANLAFDVVDASGNTLVSRDANAVGLNETLSGVLLSTPGNFYVRVYESDAPTQVQLYKLSIAGVATSPAVTASDGTFTNKVAVSWTNLALATNYRIKRNTSNNLGSAVPLGTVGAVTSFDDTTAVPGTTYFYWVEASMNAGAIFQLWAGPDTGFAQISAPGAFNLLTPADGATGVSVTPTLTWSASSGATSYTLVIDDTSDLSSPLSTVGGLGTTSYDVPPALLADCTTYYWGVTASNGGGNTASSPAIASFVTDCPVTCPADFNGDGFVTGEDFDQYVAAFEAGDPSADFNGDGFVTGEDFDAFAAAFEAGC